MAEEYLLSSFEVTELLYKVISKRNRELKPVEDPGIIKQKDKTPSPIELSKILEICDQDYAENFSIEKLTPPGRARAGKAKSPRLLYLMMLASRRGVPYYISESDLSSLLKYLNIDPETQNPYKMIEPRKLSQRLLDFEGSCWKLYYPGQDVNLNPRIGCAILEFLSFGKVRVKTVRQNYLGHFSTYGRDEHYLHMRLKTVPYNTRDLSIIVYCGAYKPELMLGQFNNIERKISSGKTVLEPLSETFEELEPKHINLDTEEYLQINHLIRQHLIDQSSNEVVTPSEITTYNSFERYIKHGVKY